MEDPARKATGWHLRPMETVGVFAAEGEALIRSCDNYLGERTGRYEWRALRYRAALRELEQLGLCDADTIFDIGAGWTEFDYCLRTEGDSRARYVPVDGGIDGVQLERWCPPREAEFFIALELIEHLHDPWRLISELKRAAAKGIVITTPNTDRLGAAAVRAMDETHFSPISRAELEESGFAVEERSFYGGELDSLLATWAPRRRLAKDQPRARPTVEAVC